MSIDARVETVMINDDGSGSLELIDRPRTPWGNSPGIAGQSRLTFDSSPEEITALNGRDVWGGAGHLMLGQRKIADRIGYARIRFVDRASFVDAVRVYHAHSAAEA